jgi:ribose transport system ATP-binding protein
MENVIELRNINKHFPGVTALANIDFSLKYGKTHGLIGENGSGKSTLIKIICGVYTPDSGKIFVRGKLIKGLNPIKAKNLGIAAIHQHFPVVPGMTVAQNIFLGQEPGGLLILPPSTKIYESANKYLQMVGLQISPKQYVEKLKTSERQLLSIARVLSMNAKILIMDEPTAALGVQEIDNLFKILEKLKKAGVSILFISHFLEHVKETADHVTVLRDGNVVATIEDNIKSCPISFFVEKMFGDIIKPNFFERNVDKKIVHSPSVLSIKRLTLNDKFVNINFDIKTGEIVGVAGLLGSGRSELIKAVSGALKYNSGSVLVEGCQITKGSRITAMKAGIGIIPADRAEEGLILLRNVAENISLAKFSKVSTFFPISIKKTRDIVSGFCSRLKIKTPSINQKVKLLSGGNQQKVVIAKALAQGSKILLFDEPTQGIDVAAKVEIYELINELALQGKGILISSSEIDELVRICDRILVMRKGRLVSHYNSKFGFSPKRIYMDCLGEGKNVVSSNNQV